MEGVLRVVVADQFVVGLDVSWVVSMTLCEVKPCLRVVGDAGLARVGGRPCGFAGVFLIRPDLRFG